MPAPNCCSELRSGKRVAHPLCGNPSPPNAQPDILVSSDRGCWADATSSPGCFDRLRPVRGFADRGPSPASAGASWATAKQQTNRGASCLYPPAPPGGGNRQIIDVWPRVEKQKAHRLEAIRVAIVSARVGPGQPLHDEQPRPPPGRVVIGVGGGSSYGFPLWYAIA